MNSFKTDLYKISFEVSDTIDPCVTITNIQTDEYIDLFVIDDLCRNVDELLRDGKIEGKEAIRIIRRSASFFMLNY